MKGCGPGRAVVATWALLMGLAASAGHAQTPSEAESAAAAAAAVPAAAAAPASTPRVQRPPPEWVLRIEAPAPFDDILTQHLDIARISQLERERRDSLKRSQQVQQAVGGDAPLTPVALTSQPVSRSELRRLVSAAPEQARGMLDAEGYFAARIDVSMSDEEVHPLIVVAVRVELGPRTTVSTRDIVFEGDLDLRLGDGQPQAIELVERMDEQWPLQPGAVFTQSAWTSARNAGLTLLRAEGYPLAMWSGSAVTVDASLSQARIFLVADSGPLFHFGPVTVQGTQRQPASAVLNSVPWRKGEPFRERLVFDYEERLQALNLFDSVFVSMDPAAETAAEAPITVRVRESKLQQATLGVGASTDTGPRMSLEHTHRKIFDLPAQLRTRLQLGRDDSLLGTEILSHPVGGGRRRFAAVEWQRQTGVDSAVTTSQKLKAGVNHPGNRLERSTYVEYQRAQVDSEQGDLLSEASAVQGIMQYTWRDVDSRTLPTKGITMQAIAGLGRTFASNGTDGPFSRLYGQLRWYRPLPAGWHASARAEAGYVISRDDVTLPDTLLFRAGGDESVRGYRFGSLGVQSQGVTLGGRTLATGSIELAHQLMPSQPMLWGAVFLDAGDAAADWQDWSPKLGYGVGLRLRTPLGPLKLDLARGQEVGGYRIHFSVGLSL